MHIYATKLRDGKPGVFIYEWHRDDTDDIDMKGLVNTIAMHLQWFLDCYLDILVLNSLTHGVGVSNWIILSTRGQTPASPVSPPLRYHVQSPNPS